MSCFPSLPSFYSQSLESLCRLHSWFCCPSLVLCTVKSQSFTSSIAAHIGKGSQEKRHSNHAHQFQLKSLNMNLKCTLNTARQSYYISLIYISLFRHSRQLSYLLLFPQVSLTLTLLPILLGEKRKVSQKWTLSDLHHHFYLLLIPSYTAFQTVCIDKLAVCLCKGSPSICALDSESLINLSSNSVSFP